MPQETWPTKDLMQAWTAADAMWMAEIKKTFPREWPGDVRYTRRANGEPGSPLRAAYDRYVAARDKARKAAGWL